MELREDFAGLKKPFAHRLVAMIECRLITFREFIPWTDSLIARPGKSPAWIIDLATVKYTPRAAEIVRQYAFSEPFEHLSADVFADECVACFSLRYARHELSWATFLEEAGLKSDRSNEGREPCEYFFHMLNALEEADFLESTEVCQKKEVESRYADVIQSIRLTYGAMRAFRGKSP